MNDSEISKLLAQYPCTRLSPTTAITCPARLSWIALAKPIGSKTKPEDLRYRATLLFHPSSDLTELKKLAQDAAVDKWKDKLQEIVARCDGRGNPIFKKPLLMQDFRAGKVDGYAVGGWLCNVATKRAPVIVDGSMNVMNPADTAAVYSGMWARVKLSVRAYDKEGCGVIFDLEAIQKVADDNAFGGSGAGNADGFTAIAGAKPSAAATQSASSLF